MKHKREGKAVIRKLVKDFGNGIYGYGRYGNC